MEPVSFVTFAVGITTISIAMLVGMFNLKCINRQLRKQNAEQQAQIDDLKRELEELKGKG